MAVNIVVGATVVLAVALTVRWIVKRRGGCSCGGCPADCPGCRKRRGELRCGGKEADGGSDSD